jgi:DNA-binding NarL/FixJ family response regulator
MPGGDHIVNTRFDAEANPMRLVVADARTEVRSALRLLLEQDGEMSVSAEAATVDELAEQVATACPDVILLDCDLPGLRAKEFLPQLRSACPRVQVVAMCSRAEMRGAAQSAGADAFVCKTEPPEKLLAVLRQCLGAVRTAGSGNSHHANHSHISG